MSGRSTKYVALLRGINLGGKNRLAMKDLTVLFADRGCEGIETYIQSGNVIFCAPASLVKKIPQIVQDEIAERFGLRVPVVVRSAKEMADVVSNNPFSHVAEPEKWLHVSFLAGMPEPSAIAKLDPDRSPPDKFEVRNREIYLHLPNGMGNTKLTSTYLDTKLGVIGTARNWATVNKLVEMLNR